MPVRKYHCFQRGNTPQTRPQPQGEHRDAVPHADRSLSSGQSCCGSPRGSWALEGALQAPRGCCCNRRPRSSYKSPPNSLRPSEASSYFCHLPGPEHGQPHSSAKLSLSRRQSSIIMLSRVKIIKTPQPFCHIVWLCGCACRSCTHQLLRPSQGSCDRCGRRGTITGHKWGIYCVAGLHPCFLCLSSRPIFALFPLVSLGAGPVSRRPQSASSGFIVSHHAASLCQCGHVLWRALHCRPLSLPLCPMSSRCVACRISRPLCFHPYRSDRKDCPYRPAGAVALTLIFACRRTRPSGAVLLVPWSFWCSLVQ